MAESVAHVGYLVC